MNEFGSPEDFARKHLRPVPLPDDSPDESAAPGSGRRERFPLVRLADINASAHSA
jgi:hypothetical protein